MKIVVYKMYDNSIVRITSDNISISDVENDEDFCPLSFFEQTEDGRKALENFKQLINE